MSQFELTVGTVIGHFRLDKQLGAGGMGAVYLAQDLTLSRLVAIKFMSRELLARQRNASVREGLEKRFMREARSAAALNHPNLAQIYEANFESEYWYIAMEFIDGQALVDLAKPEAPMDVNEVVAILRQVCGGLLFAWNSAKIIHRDIKPHNLMLTKGRVVKIVDLGLAKPIVDAAAESEADALDVTMAGTPVGTPMYMAPEQATGSTEINFHADIYALGATAYELLTGQKCFPQRTPATIYMAQMNRQYVPLRQVRPSVPAPLAALVDEMLIPDPADRIASYELILQRLDEISLALAPGAVTRGASQVAGYNPDQTIIADTPVAKEPIDRTTLLLTVGGLAALVLAGGVGYMVWQHSRPVTVVASGPGATAPTMGTTTTPAVSIPAQPPQNVPPDSGTALPPLAPAVPAVPSPATTVTPEQKQVLQARVRSEAQRLQTSLAEQLVGLTAGQRAAEGVARVQAIAQEADAAYTKGDFAAAIAAYQRAIAKCQDERQALQDRLRDEADKAAADVTARRAKTRAFDDLDPALAERVAQYNIAQALAQESVGKEDFLGAIAQYQQAGKLCDDMAKLVNDKFTPTPGQNFTVAKAGLEMVWLAPLKVWVGKYEVTNGEYRRFKPSHDSRKSQEGFSFNGDRQPVVRVAYYDAVAYCTWLTLQLQKQNLLPAGHVVRLPSKEEWQQWARCGDQRLYPWGSDWPPKFGHFGKQEMFPKNFELGDYTDEFVATCPVEKSGKNDWGLYGLAGNVWEWTTAERDRQRAVLGGAWTEVQKAVLRIEPPGYIYADPAEQDFDNIGFRVMLAPPPPPADAAKDVPAAPKP